jgi:hypothetical protein
MAKKKQSKSDISEARSVDELAVEIAAASGGSLTPDAVKAAVKVLGFRKKKISLIEYVAALLKA